MPVPVAASVPTGVVMPTGLPAVSPRSLNNKDCASLAAQVAARRDNYMSWMDVEIPFLGPSALTPLDHTEAKALSKEEAADLQIVRRRQQKFKKELEDEWKLVKDVRCMVNIDLQDVVAVVRDTSTALSLRELSEHYEEPNCGRHCGATNAEQTLRLWHKIVNTHNLWLSLLSAQ